MCVTHGSMYRTKWIWEARLLRHLLSQRHLLQEERPKGIGPINRKPSVRVRVVHHLSFIVWYRYWFSMMWLYKRGDHDKTLQRDQPAIFATRQIQEQKKHSRRNDVRDDDKGVDHQRDNTLCFKSGEWIFLIEVCYNTYQPAFGQHIMMTLWARENC